MEANAPVQPGGSAESIAANSWNSEKSMRQRNAVECFEIQRALATILMARRIESEVFRWKELGSVCLEWWKWLGQAVWSFCRAQDSHPWSKYRRNAPSRGGPTRSTCGIKRMIEQLLFNRCCWLLYVIIPYYQPISSCLVLMITILMINLQTQTLGNKTKPSRFWPNMNN